MLLREYANYIDPVHGNIPYSEDESKLIQHPIFQRLHKIKQLGTVYTVYPSATHTRFAHSIGVMHIAGKIFEALLKDQTNFYNDLQSFKSLEYVFKSIRIASLLHDLGHGPYSHEFETLLKNSKVSDLKNELAKPVNWISDNGKKTTYTNSKLKHEHYSYALIGVILNEVELTETFYPQDICCFLDDTFSPTKNLEEHLKQLSGALGSKSWETLLKTLKAIQSSDIDADRLDYLQRDSLFCGIKITGIDFHHILSSIKLCTDDQGLFYIEAKKNVIPSIDQTLISRKLMFDQVYLHWEHCYYGTLITDTLRDYKIVNIEQITTSYRDYIYFNDDTIDEAMKIQVKNIKINKKLENHQKKLLIYFFKIKPKKHHQEQFLSYNAEIELQKLSLAFPDEDYQIVSLPLKTFSELTRLEGNSKSNSMIKVKTKITKEILTPFNLYSEVFKSSLWIDIKQRATAIDSTIKLFKENEDMLIAFHSNQFQGKLTANHQTVLKKIVNKK